LNLADLDAQTKPRTSLIAHNTPKSTNSKKLEARFDSSTGKWGLAYEGGAFVVAPTLDYISELTNGFYTVYKMREITIKSSTNSTITDIRPFFGFIDETGKYLVRPETSKYIDAYNFTADGYAMVTKLLESGKRQTLIINKQKEEMEF
jgi:hypothetical protein